MARFGNLVADAALPTNVFGAEKPVFANFIIPLGFRRAWETCPSRPFRANDVNDQALVSKFQALFYCLSDAFFNPFLDDNPIHDDVNVMALVGIERHLGTDFVNVAVNAGTHEAGFQCISECEAMFTAPPSHDRC